MTTFAIGDTVRVKDAVVALYRDDDHEAIDAMNDAETPSLVSSMINVEMNVVATECGPGGAWLTLRDPNGTTWGSFPEWLELVNADAVEFDTDEEVDAYNQGWDNGFDCGYDAGVQQGLKQAIARIQEAAGKLNFTLSALEEEYGRLTD